MRRLAVALLALLAPALYAIDYRVELKNASNDTTAKALLQARRVDGDADPIERRISIPSQGTIDVAEGTWELAIVAENVWAPPIYARAAESVRIEALPAGRLHAPIAGESSPLPEFTVHLTPATPQFRGDPFKAVIPCPVVERELRCTVPAGTHDIRIIPFGHVPQFRWNVTFAANTIKKLEPLKLVKGASVIGTVVRQGGSALPANTRVTLNAMNVEDSRTTAMQARPNAKGFFELPSVPPGQYRLTATAQSLTSDTRMVVVIANRTAELITPLVLDTPKRFRALVHPTLDPDGQPWLIELARQQATGRFDTVASRAVDSEGVWEQKSLPDGEYLLSVSRRDNSGQWMSQHFTLRGADVELPVSIPMIRAKGSVSYGDRPIAASLHFGGQYGAVKQLLKSNDEGTFSGVLPMKEEDRWDIFVETATPPMRTTLMAVKPRTNADGELEFDLHVPHTILLGTVVRADGEPAAQAIVSLQHLESAKTEQMNSGHDGSFQFAGVKPGRYRATAEEFLEMSDAVEVEVSEEENPTLRLTLKKIQQLKGRVLGNGAVPVIGARLTAISRNTPPPFEHIAATSSESGTFTLLVPPETNLIDLLITPPGFASMLTRTTVKTDLELQITVDQSGGTLIADVPANPAIMLNAGGASLWLTLVAGTNGGTITDTEGRRRVVIPSMAAGPYEICLADRCKSGSLSPHGTLTLTMN